MMGGVGIKSQTNSEILSGENISQEMGFSLNSSLRFLCNLLYLISNVLFHLSKRRHCAIEIPNEVIITGSMDDPRGVSVYNQQQQKSNSRFLLQ